MWRYQFIWHRREDWALAWCNWKRDETSGMRFIYDWLLQVGPLEIRRWQCRRKL